jgi:hypothetical protein
VICEAVTAQPSKISVSMMGDTSPVVPRKCWHGDDAYNSAIPVIDGCDPHLK